MKSDNSHFPHHEDSAPPSPIWGEGRGGGFPFLLLIFLLSFAPAEHKITIFTIGDSTMANKDTTGGNPERGWAMALPQFFDPGKVTVDNHAVNGRSSKSFFDEGRWKAVTDKLQKGDYVFIQFGHNDEKSEDPKRYTDPKGSYKEFLTMYVNETRAKGAVPVLMTSIARRKFDGGMPMDTHGEYLVAVRELAKTLDVPVIDMAGKTRKLLLRTGSDDSKRMFMWLQPGQSPKYPNGLQDDTHLNEYGAFIVAQLAVEGIRELNLPIAQYLKKDVAGLSWQQIVEKQPGEWYGTGEAEAIAGNVLLYQRNTGGWPKNIPVHNKLSESDKKSVLAEKNKTDDSTMDNNATYLEMIYLAKVYHATHKDTYREAFVKALHYLIEAQYPNGGWPQYYPLVKGYYSHITYNDNLMVNVMTILKGVAGRDKLFAFVDDPALIKQCAAAFDRGVDCILKTQYRQNGKPTVWCAQHDEVTLQPAKARAYELPSLSGYESADIVLLLMDIENPKPEVKQAIAGAVAWFGKTQIKGIRVETFTNADGQKDRRVVSDPTAKPIWARFYELDDNRPFFCDRDGIKKYSLSEIGYERRNGYGWYTDEPQEVLNKFKHK